MKAPKPGDRIVHVLPHLNEERRGEVEYLVGRGETFAYRSLDQACECTFLCSVKQEPWRYDE